MPGVRARLLASGAASLATAAVLLGDSPITTPCESYDAQQWSARYESDCPDYMMQATGALSIALPAREKEFSETLNQTFNEALRRAGIQAIAEPSSSIYWHSEKSTCSIRSFRLQFANVSASCAPLELAADADADQRVRCVYYPDSVRTTDAGPDASTKTDTNVVASDAAIADLESDADVERDADAQPRDGTAPELVDSGAPHDAHAPDAGGALDAARPAIARQCVVRIVANKP